MWSEAVKHSDPLVTVDGAFLVDYASPARVRVGGAFSYADLVHYWGSDARVDASNDTRVHVADQIQNGAIQLNWDPAVSTHLSFPTNSLQLFTGTELYLATTPHAGEPAQAGIIDVPVNSGVDQHQRVVTRDAWSSLSANGLGLLIKVEFHFVTPHQDTRTVTVQGVMFGPTRMKLNTYDQDGVGSAVPALGARIPENYWGAVTSALHPYVDITPTPVPGFDPGYEGVLIAGAVLRAEGGSIG
jgi:hypothetical protein